MRTLFFLFTFLFFSLASQAQVKRGDVKKEKTIKDNRDSRDNRNRDSDDDNEKKNTDRGSLGDTLVITPLDTLSNDVFRFSLDHLSERAFYNDSTLHNFEEYEMTEYIKGQSFLTRNIHLGNTGSASTSIFWKQKYNDHFQLGFNQHNVYKFKEKDIRFYKIEKPYSKVSFSPGSSQSSFRSQALLVRDFAHDVQLTFKFNRINSESIYENQNVRHTSVHIGLYQRIDSTKWAYSLNLISNSNFEASNGGIVSKDGFIESGASVRSQLEINLTDGFNYQLSRNYMANVYYMLQDKEVSKQYFQVKISHDRGLYKYINESLSTRDSSIFTTKYIPSEIGMRMSLVQHRSTIRASYHLENNLLKSFYYVRYRLNQVQSDIKQSNISELVGGTENNFEWKGLSVDLDGYAGTVYNRFLLDLHPKIGYNYKEKAGIKAGFRLHTEPSAYSINHYEVSFQNIRDEDPFILSSQELYGELDIPLIGFKGKISSYAGQNIPVLDTTGLEFTKENINYIQVDLQEKISYKWLHFDNRIATQIRTKEVYSMPAWYSHHELYLQGNLFGSLDFQTGIIGDFVPQYSLPSYSPLYGRFYTANTDPEGFFYRLDVYASMKVEGFRFFVKYEHLNDLWDDSIIYEVYNYPQFDGRLRLGVSWELRN